MIRPAALALLVSGFVQAAPLPPEPAELLALTPEIHEQLQQSVLDRSRSADRRLDLLVELMFSPEGLDLAYSLAPTRTAAETFTAARGNCLSFTMLFLAMAEAVGIEAHPQELRRAPDVRREGNALFEAGHVNLLVRTERRRAIVDFAPELIDHRGGRNLGAARTISRTELKAHYYSNRAAEILAAGDAATARTWNDQALALAPELVGALNNRGVIESRLGNLDLAEAHYQSVLAIDSNNVNALFNLLYLYQRSSRDMEAGQVRERLESLNPRDPYFQWALGRQFEDDGDFRQAMRLFGRATRMQPSEPMFHAALARAAAALGHEERAERALGQARVLLEASPETIPEP